MLKRLYITKLACLCGDATCWQGTYEFRSKRDGKVISSGCGEVADHVPGLSRLKVGSTVRVTFSVIPPKKKKGRK